MRQIILASQSKTRKLLLNSLGIPFIIIPADIDEKEVKNPNLRVRALEILTPLLKKSGFEPHPKK